MTDTAGTRDTKDAGEASQASQARGTKGDGQAKGTGKVVVAPYITLRVVDENTGSKVLHGFYQGAPVPEGVDPGDLERHERKGMIADKDSPEAEAAAPGTRTVQFDDNGMPTADLPKPADAKPADAKPAAKPVDAETDDGKPKPTDDKATWLDYRINERVQKRLPGQPEEQVRARAQAELEGKTKADLVAGR